jgi:hypothetical protein
LNQSFADFFGLSYIEAFKLNKTHIKEFIPEIKENIDYILNQKRDENLTFKGILQLPDNAENNNTAAFSVFEESSENDPDINESITKLKNAFKSFNRNSNRNFKRMKKYSINYEIMVDGFQPHGSDQPLKIFVICITEVNDPSKSSTSLFESLKQETSSEYNQEPHNQDTKIIITQAPDGQGHIDSNFSVKYLPIYDS